MNESLLNQPYSVSTDFLDINSNYFFFTEIASWDATGMSGTIVCKRYRRKLRLSFNQEMLPFEEARGWEFPDDYGQDKIIRFRILPLQHGVIRLLFLADKTGTMMTHEVPLIMQDGVDINTPENDGWYISENEDEILYTRKDISIKLSRKPFILTITKNGKEIIRTVSISEKTGIMNDNPVPCGFIQQTGTERREIAFSSFISHDEKFFGCGESFTRLDKRGQQLDISSNDPKGVSTSQMYKPVPFFMSSKEYGCLVHSSCPMTFDFGHSYDGVQTIFSSENCLDLFIFTGKPKEILSKYTEYTGRSPMLPEWSFGLWMGRISYNSQKQIEEVAHKLRQYDIPCDVIHIDTGWFEKDWGCDFEFSPTRFPELESMIRKLHEEGFHISLWQLPYFTPQNKYYKQLVENKMVITDPCSETPTEDAILDFTNEKAIAWYQERIKGLLDLGIDVIKADFGEGAPYHGFYSNGKSGLYEHNIYPLRYNKAVSDITEKEKGWRIIWGRSAWAGSQRYPLHWGGDAENTNQAMAATLRGGLSFGLSGFTFWSHDLGGFVKTPSEDLYLRWFAFGMFTSHARCHGNPPREPWDFSEPFMNEFRRLVKIRAKLMPYILGQARASCENGWPMIRSLFFEFPEDKTAWHIEDEYMFGDSLLVAPLLEDNAKRRQVYLPHSETEWTDYFSGEKYSGGKWHEISTENHIVVISKREINEIQ